MQCRMGLNIQLGCGEDTKGCTINNFFLPATAESSECNINSKGGVLTAPPTSVPTLLNVCAFKPFELFELFDWLHKKRKSIFKVP